jgi:hypothetical protein
VGSYGTDVQITAGSGTPIATFLAAGGDHVQVVRENKATAVTTNSWTVNTTASTSQIAADINRVGLTIVSAASGRVYFRFDSTAPTASTYHWYLDPGDRWEVPNVFSELAVSMLGAVSGGTVLSLLGTAS